MDNKLVKRKIQTYEIILCIFVLAVVAAGLLMPKTGSLSNWQSSFRQSVQIQSGDKVEQYR